EAKTATLEGGQGFSLGELRPHIQDEVFVFWDARFSGNLDLSTLLDFHRNMRGLLTAAVSPGLLDSPTGNIGQVYGSKIVGLSAGKASAENGLALAGVFVIEPQVVEHFGDSNLYGST